MKFALVPAKGSTLLFSFLCLLLSIESPGIDAFCPSKHCPLHFAQKTKLSSPSISTHSGATTCATATALLARGGWSGAEATGKLIVENVTPILERIWTLCLKFATIVFQELKQLTPLQKALFVGIFAQGIFIGRKSSSGSWQRFTQAVDIPSIYFGPKAPLLKGRVVSVSDGDTFRFYHRPTIFHSSKIETKTKDKNKKKKVPKMSEIAMPIRICTIDTPETSKFGKPGQPFGIEAKEKLMEYIDGKMIRIRLLQKDQYGRAVAQVFARRRKCVDELLLKEGLAEVYQGMGAVYGPLGKEAYLQMEQEAQMKKIGIWSQKKRESAAEYKRRTK